MDIDRQALEEWQKQQPLCILSLDPADRAVLRVAGKQDTHFFLHGYFIILSVQFGIVSWQTLALFHLYSALYTFASEFLIRSLLLHLKMQLLSKSKIWVRFWPKLCGWGKKSMRGLINRYVVSRSLSTRVAKLSSWHLNDGQRQKWIEKVTNHLNAGVDKCALNDSKAHWSHVMVNRPFE